MSEVVFDTTFPEANNWTFAKAMGSPFVPSVIFPFIDAVPALFSDKKLLIIARIKNVVFIIQFFIGYSEHKMQGKEIFHKMINE